MRTSEVRSFPNRYPLLVSHRLIFCYSTDKIKFCTPGKHIADLCPEIKNELNIYL